MLGDNEKADLADGVGMYVCNHPDAPVRPLTGVSQAMHHRVDRRRTRKEAIPRHTPARTTIR